MILRRYKFAQDTTGVVAKIKVSSKLPLPFSGDSSSAGDRAASQPGDLQPLVLSFSNGWARRTYLLAYRFVPPPKT